MKYNIIPTFLLLGVVGVIGIEGTATTNQAWGWNGEDEGQGCCGDNYLHWGIGNFLRLQGYQQQGPRPYDNGYNAGIADAVYDHQNNLVYNPQGRCLTRHSELYWHGFREGYDKQWNSYNYQANTQGTSINIYGNNNYVSTNQDSTQASGSSLLRTIGQGLCNLAGGCSSAGGYGNGPEPIQGP